MRRSVLLTAMLVLTCTVAWGCFAVTAFAAGDSSEGACQHKFDKANVCTACGYEKSGTVTLKAKKLAYVNQKTWIRLKAPKKGFVTLKYKNAADEAESITLQVYNASKKKFKYMDVRTNEKGHMFFPVDKATYYLRLKDPTSAAVKYTFKAVKIPPASGIDKARGKKPLAKNKTATVLSFAGHGMNSLPVRLSGHAYRKGYPPQASNGHSRRLICLYLTLTLNDTIFSADGL